MTKKGLKQLRNKLYREMSRAMHERAARIQAEETAEYYKDRFRKFGSNVDTVEPDSGKLVQMLKWEIEPQPWGTYALVDPHINERVIEQRKRQLAENIARGLIERDILQFIVKSADYDCPLTKHGTIAAKLYAVPWEQMPHSKIIELKQYSDEIIDRSDKKLNARQAAKAAAARITELERVAALSKADIIDYNRCILDMIAGHSACEWCEDRQECQEAGKTEINGCDDWMLRSQPTGGDGKDDSERIFSAGEDRGTGTENAECQTPAL